MTDAQKLAFQEYEKLKLEIKEKETRLKELAPTVIEAIPEGQEVATEQGVFLVQYRSKWEYTDRVKELASRLKEAQAEEQATGDAEEERLPVLYYKAKKKE